MKKQAVSASDGDLFVVRSFEGKDIALGLIVRGGKKMIRLGYFFRLTGLEYSCDTSGIDLLPSSAIYVARFGGLKLRSGDWPVIGRLKDFSVEDWPVPIFVQTNILRNENEYFIYDESAKNLIGHYTENTFPDDLRAMPQAEDGLAGPVYVEQKIEIILKSSNH